MRKRKLRFFICAIIQLSVSVFFFFAAAFISGDLKNHIPSAIEIYDTEGLKVSVAQASSFAEQEGFAAAGTGEKVLVTDEGENLFLPIIRKQRQIMGNMQSCIFVRENIFLLRCPTKML
jgi:hypothetical protein